MDNVGSVILLAIVVLVVVFLILREVMCWYLKINERINLQKEQNLILKRILDELDEVKIEPKPENESSTQKNEENHETI